LHHAWFEAKVAFLFGCYFPAVFVTPEQPDHKEPGSLLGFGHQPARRCLRSSFVMFREFLDIIVDHRIQ